MSDFGSDSNLTPTAGDTAATPAPATPQGTPVGASSPTTSQPPATGGIPEGYVPSHRIRETREAAIRQAQQEFAIKEANYAAKLEQLQRNLQALTGVQPPPNPEIDAVRSQFSKLYPGLSKIESQAEKFEQMVSKLEDMEQQNQHYWGTHATNTVDSLYREAANSLGQELSPDAKQQLRASFVGFIQTNPEHEARYQNDAAGLVKDFWKAFSSQFIDPVRRASTVASAARIPSGLPQDTAGGAPQITPPAKLTSLDDRAATAWANFKSNTNR